MFGQATAGLGKLQQSATALSSALGGIAAGGFVGSLGAMVRSTVNLADELNKLAQRTGITVESLSAIQNAAELADVSTEEFTTGIRKLNLALVEAQDGTSKTAQIFKALGVDATKGAEVALRGISEAFSKLPDGATKAAVATEIFGRAGEKLIPLLNGGSAALDQARAAAERYGTLISGKLAADSEALNDNLTKLGQSARALGVGFANALVPSLVTISDNLVVARERGGLFIQTLREIDKLVISAFGGVENLFTGGGGFFDRRAAAQFQFYADQENPEAGRRRLQEVQSQLLAAQGRSSQGGDIDSLPPSMRSAARRVNENLIKRLQGEVQDLQRRLGPTTPEDVGPQLPSGRAPDPAALLRALAPPRAAGAGGRASGGLSLDDLMAQAAARRIALQDANESTFNADADRQQRELLDFYADLALAQQLRIELAEQEGERAADSLQREADAIKDRLDPTREYIRALERVAELQERGLLNDREAIAETNRLAEALRNNGKAAQDSERLARELGLTFTSAFEAAIGGSKSFRDILKGLESDLLKVGTRELLTKPFLGMFQDFLKPSGGNAGGGGFGSIVSSIAGAFGFGGGTQLPGRAAGGPVSAGMGYLVGEKGPELFLPRQSGSIVPNGAMGGATIVFNVSTPDANSFRQSQGQMLAQAHQQMARAGRRNG
ncbi:MAG: phage tail tape measure protein [Rhodocyclaceae bacterium]|nr:phage tail tape measure protein [Rhodocyclaceae bacterium]